MRNLERRVKAIGDAARKMEVTMAYTIKVNAVDRSVDVDGDTPLFWVLRDVLGLTGTKLRPPGRRSDRAVKPRRSEDHSTALISSPVPRRIWPASTRGPVLAPRWALSTFREIALWLCIST